MKSLVSSKKSKENSLGKTISDEEVNRKPNLLFNNQLAKKTLK